jgi:hypothetical protein
MKNLEELTLRLYISFCFTNVSATLKSFWSKGTVNKPFYLCKTVTLLCVKDWPTVILCHFILSSRKCVLIVFVSVTAAALAMAMAIAMAMAMAAI